MLWETLKTKPVGIRVQMHCVLPECTHGIERGLEQLLAPGSQVKLLLITRLKFKRADRSLWHFNHSPHALRPHGVAGNAHGCSWSGEDRNLGKGRFNLRKQQLCHS